MHGKNITKDELQTFVQPIFGLAISHMWQGYGSALFLECGLLTPSARQRRDGSLGNPVGEFTVMVEWSWRIEGKRRIWCGSWSDEDKWPRFFSYLRGATITDIALFGRLPELNVTLSNGLHLVSFTTSDGDPEWGIVRHDADKTMSVGVRGGRLMLNEQ